MKKGLFFIVFLLSVLFTNAQNSNISGIINNYGLGVHQISSIQLNIEQIASFSVNDTILVYQTKGATCNTTANTTFGDISSIGNAGNYDFSIIQSIDNINKIITLSCPLQNTYDDSLFQVVKVKTYNNATVTNTLTCAPWDGEKGGVLVIIVNGTLTLDEDIDVTGKGFRGAIPNAMNTLNKCSNEATGGIFNYYYTSNGYDSSGLKGEGIAKIITSMARGRGKWANGGGGGNGINSGGGGGSHAGIGGNGGRESDMCLAVTQNYGGIGGVNLFNSTSFNANKLFMGGGGGCGTYEQYSTDVSKGGNGGGLAIIIANNVITNGNTITSNGESITYTTTYESAGGGGGGGTIIFLANVISGSIGLYANGGTGGSSNIFSCRGSGGGGSGGVVYFSCPTTPTLSVQKGLAGTACSNYVGTNGGDGFATNTFQFKMNCLLANNNIWSNQTICSGQQPSLLNGTEDFSFYSYLWQYSTDNINWNDCPSINNQPNYQPGNLYQTTYYRRIVQTFSSTLLISNIVTITIHPFYLSNTFTNVTCFGACNGTINEIVNPNNQTYTFHWSNGGSTPSLTNLCSGTYIVTVTNADGCSQTDSVTITQPPQLTVSMSHTDVTCYGENTGSATATPSGGTAPYIYNWSNGQTSQTISSLYAGTYTVIVKDAHNCTTAASVTITQPPQLIASATIQQPTCPYNCDGSFTPNASGGVSPYQFQSSTSQYTDLCSGTYFITVTDHNGCSDTASVTLTPSTNLQNNIISTLSNVCEGTNVNITGTIPSGAGVISYNWLISTDNLTWNNAPPINYNQNYLWIANQSSYFKRIISGNNCYDTSNVIYINVINITNHISTPDSIYCLNEAILPIMGNDSLGYHYTWQINTNLGWTNITGATSANYTPTFEPGYHEFKRIVNFNGCSDTSNIVNIFIADTIQNQIFIDGTDTVKQYCSEASGNIGNLITGPSTNFHIIWQTSFDSIQWTNLPDTNLYISFSLNDYANHRYYYYRRLIEQKSCFDTSNVILIDLLAPIIQSNIVTNQGTSPAYICAGDNIGIGSLSIIGGTGSYQYQWLQSTDSVNWTNAVGINYLQYFNTQSLFSSMAYMRIVTSGVCIDTSNIYTVIVSTLPANTIACNNINVCQGDSITTLYETSSTTGIGLTYQWQWLNNGTWENIPGAINANYTPPFEVGYRTYRRIISLNACTSNSNEITIAGYLPPSINYFLVENDSLCLTSGVSAHIHTHMEGTPPWNIIFDINGVQHNVSQMQPDTEYSFIVNQDYYTIFVNQINDASPCQATFITDTIHIWGFNPVNANASNMELCGNSATLQASDPNPGIGTWIIPAPLTINDIHHPNAQVFASAYNTYTIIWKVVNGPCIDTSLITLSFYEQPQVPDAGLDMELLENEPVVLQATMPTAGQGTWSVLEGNAVFSDIHNSTTTASGFTEGNNVLRWTITNGICPAVYDDISILLKNIFIPEGFSPNNDGINDLFVIQGISESDNFELYIFNRWGNTVYHKIPYNNTWNGKDMNENILPDDTYFYLLKKNDKLIKDGFVILKQ